MAASRTTAPQDSVAQDYPLPINPPARRLESIDLLRGLLMILMALDHTRDFFTSARVNQTDPLQSWPALFATRWVTHLCAPGFIALAGASVYLQKRRGKSSSEVSKLLFTRGLWLVLLDLTVVNFAWFFTIDPFLQVIWVIGASMMVLAALQRLGVVAVGLIGAAILLGHNLLDPIHASALGGGADLWKLFHEPGMLLYHQHPIGLVIYPVLPWLGVMCVGYAFGPLAASAPALRQKVASLIGLVFLTAFTCLRAIGHYGDAFRWQHLATPAETAMSFLQVEKYPPSLDYALVTLGILLLLYALFDVAVTRNWLAAARGFVGLYGRVPLFYYVLHIYLIHGMAVASAVARHLDWHQLIGYSGLMEDWPAAWGYGLPVVYAVWIVAVLVLYAPCLWFSRLKARRRDWWLSYL